MKKLKEKNNKGFVILIAVLVAGIFVVIGASILLISVKELELSVGETQSQYAFYAADTGMECALYWDLRYSAFATTTSSSGSPEPTSLYCDGVNIVAGKGWDWLANKGGKFKDLGHGPSNKNIGNTIFSMIGEDLYPNDPKRNDCVIVYVVKEWDPAEKKFDTYIESRGYNTCDETDPRRVERALRATY